MSSKLNDLYMSLVEGVGFRRGANRGKSSRGAKISRSKARVLAFGFRFDFLDGDICVESLPHRYVMACLREKLVAGIGVDGWVRITDLGRVALADYLATSNETVEELASDRRRR